MFLDYGVDSIRCGAGEVDVSERGMRFTTQWKFDIGTQLAVSLSELHPRLGLRRVAIEGIVVWCERKPDQRHESTLLFLELPEDVKAALREFSHQLAVAE